MDDLDDEQRQLIPHPLRELTQHCIYKGLELGPTVTIATVLPYQLYKSKKNLAIIPILSRVGTATIYGAIGGALLSVAIMHFKLSKEGYNQYKIWDRSYRLRHSESQNRVDKIVLTSSVMGGLAGLFIGLPSKLSPLSATKGALLSVPFGLLFHVLVKPVQQPPIDTIEKK